jgi:hypothetical protein
LVEERAPERVVLDVADTLGDEDPVAHVDDPTASTTLTASEMVSS